MVHIMFSCRRNEKQRVSPRPLSRVSISACLTEGSFEHLQPRRQFLAPLTGQQLCFHSNQDAERAMGPRSKMTWLPRKYSGTRRAALATWGGGNDVLETRKPASPLWICELSRRQLLQLPQLPAPKPLPPAPWLSLGSSLRKGDCGGCRVCSGVGPGAATSLGPKRGHDRVLRLSQAPRGPAGRVEAAAAGRGARRRARGRHGGGSVGTAWPSRLGSRGGSPSWGSRSPARASGFSSVCQRDASVHCQPVRARCG